MFNRRSRRRCALREPRWTRLVARRLPGVPIQLHPWLSDRGSLTRAVVAGCDGRFKVEVLAEQHRHALPSEARLLRAGRAQATWVREVRLACGHDIWVFARTLIPLRNLRGPVRGLTRLGQRPLGEVLFSDPTTRRLRVEVALIRPNHHLYASATAHLRRPPRAVWGRRTLFAYGGQRILVNELFLPGIPPLER